jgi:hypothetical protein
MPVVVPVVVDSEMSIPAVEVEVDNDTQIPDFDFEKFLNDFGATPGSLADGFISGPNGDVNANANGITAAALTPRFEDVLGNAPVPTPALDFGFNSGNLASGSGSGNLASGSVSVSGEDLPAGPTLDQVKLTGLRNFFQDAKDLYTEVENWTDDVHLDEREARVLVGNQTHKLALMVSQDFPCHLFPSSC